VRRRRIAIVTSSRADFGCLTQLMHEVQDDPALELQLVLLGEHWIRDVAPAGSDVTATGLPIRLRIGAAPQGDDAGAIGIAVASALAELSRELPTLGADVVVVLGDRVEITAPALAALLHNIPLAHIHGGELSFGAIDDSIRHALTKLSSLHFVATAEYATRVLQLGEAPDAVHCVGAPALDGIYAVPPLTSAELALDLGLDFTQPVALLTYHPVTRAPGQARAQISQVLAALEQSQLAAVITTANADAAGGEINAQLRDFVARDSGRYKLFEYLGQRRYFACMRHCAVMVGNSSSGLIEAPSFALPVVNVGGRQEGRVRGANVIDVACESAAILAAMRRALTPEFRSSLRAIHIVSVHLDLILLES